ncbi:MAG: GGDEF and EAL domain-containing protein [Synechococcaceae cyanobacterium]|nr:GGDEF and EAL domain-containing protein [Synechococcaceae cyanobacterium]
MLPPAIPANDPARVLELESFGVLDTSADTKFDDISELTRSIAGTEIGIISLVDSNRQWFKSCVGAPLGQQQTPRDISFCGHTILQREPLIIEDALADPRFADNPLVTGEPHVRFYAGFPLITANGFVVGSLCAISREPHQLDAGQVESLRRLASLTVQQLEYLRESTLLASTQKGMEVDRLRTTVQERLSSLDRLISRDQMIQMLDLMFGMEVGTAFSLLRCSFRDYERVNSNLGGVVAEEYINEAARRVLMAVPRTASVARFADAEMVVLLPFAAEESEVQDVAERILAFCNHVYRNGSQALAMSLAVGIAVSHSNYSSSEAILADTSMAVRMARRSSGNAFRFIDPESRAAVRDSYRLESDFREVVASKGIDAYVQPIVNLANGEPVGFEALARWPRNGYVLSPDTFIPLATESGLTGELDLLIVEKILAALPLLAQPIPYRDMSMSVNLSGILLEDRHLRARLLTLIDDNPCPPGWTLQVELLEDIFQDTSDDFAAFLGDLVQRNVRIAIDDFGTGYSSLARLISLPIQGVKVDRVFIAKLASDEESPRTLLRTMLTMLRDLGLEITAEGVETQEQQDWLLRNGAGRAQGYLFSKPMPISEAILSLQSLDYRPRALPVDRHRIRAVRRRRLRSLFRLPFQGERRRQD